MKLAALMCTYKNLEFFKCAYKQAKSVCDMVFVSVGPHSFILEHEPDMETMKWLDSQGQEYTIVRPDKDLRYDMFQCSIWHQLVDKAVSFGATWFRFWDDDMFFFNRDISNIKHFMETEPYDCLGFKERRFAWNFKCSTNDITGFFYRVRNGMFLSPISKLHYQNGELYRDTQVIMDGVTCHHYTGVKTVERQEYRALLSAEKGTPTAGDNFRTWKSMPLPKEKCIAYSKMVPQILGGNDFEIYEGEHPEVLKDHPWKNIEDVRKV